MLRRLKWYGIGAVMLITIVLLTLLLKLDSIVKRQIVVQSSAALNVPTSLGAAHVSVMSESIGMLRFVIGAPAGFESRSMFSVNAIHTDLNVSHLRATPLVIDRLVLTAPSLVIEQAGGKLNVQALTDQPSKPPEDGSEPMTLIVKELTIENAKVTLRPGIPGIDQEFALAIPTFTVKDIGTGAGNQNGVALKQVLLVVIHSLAKSAGDSDQVPQQVRALLKLNMHDVVNQQIDQIKQKVDDEVSKHLGKLTRELDRKK